MGARISLQFRKDGQVSPVLCAHWGGMAFRDDAKQYAETVKEEAAASNCSGPLDRLEPEYAMVDFIRRCPGTTAGAYIVTDTAGCDNGEVYRFALYDESGEEVDSCGGFYSLEDIRLELGDEWKDEDLEDYLK